MLRINWGDGTITDNATSPCTHTYEDDTINYPISIESSSIICDLEAHRIYDINITVVTPFRETRINMNTTQTYTIDWGDNEQTTITGTTGTHDYGEKTVDGDEHTITITAQIPFKVEVENNAKEVKKWLFEFENEGVVNISLYSTDEFKVDVENNEGTTTTINSHSEYLSQTLEITTDDNNGLVKVYSNDKISSINFNDTGTISHFESNGNIPHIVMLKDSTIEYLNLAKVTTIDECSNLENLKELNFDDTLKSITYSFNDCPNIYGTVDIKNCKVIEESFSNCPNVEKIYCNYNGDDIIFTIDESKIYPTFIFKASTLETIYNQLTTFEKKKQVARTEYFIVIEESGTYDISGNEWYTTNETTFTPYNGANTLTLSSGDVVYSDTKLQVKQIFEVN